MSRRLLSRSLLSLDARRGGRAPQRRSGGFPSAGRGSDAASPASRRRPFSETALRGAFHAVLALAVVGGAWPHVASAQVVVNTSTVGPVYGGGSSVTVTTSGTISGIGDPGVVSTGTSVTTAVVNDGQILASGYLGLGDGYAIWSNGAPIGSITNSGRIDGEARGVTIDGDGVSAVTTLTNAATGLINGGLQFGVYNGNVLGTVVNSGTIQGADGIYSLVTTGTIDNRAGGWIQGGKAIWVDGGTLDTVANAGTVYGGRGLFVSAAAGVSTITNSGSFLGVGDFAVFASGTIGTLTNSGTFSGTGGVASLAGIDSITNQAGGRIEGTTNEGLYVSGSAGTITNAAGATITGATRGMTVDANTAVVTIANAGAITGANDYALFSSGTIGTLTNSGTFSGTGGVASLVAIGGFENQAGGRIEGTTVEALYVSGSAGAVTNATGAAIAGATRGVTIAANTTVATISNAGTITGASDFALFSFGTIGTLTNSGTFSGTGGVASLAGVDSITNQSGGRIEGTTVEGLYVSGSAGTVTNAAGATISGGTRGVTIAANTAVATLANAGTITGAGDHGILVSGTIGAMVNSGRIEGTAAGVFNEGAILGITNSGTIAYTGSGSGPALFNTGVIGDLGGGQPAITSTASGALIAGTIVNQGTIAGGFVIANQDVTVAAGATAGTFVGGTLAVLDGDLTFAAGGGGLLSLGSDVAVHGGAGTFVNQAALAVFDVRHVTGGFLQSPAGSFISALDGVSAGQHGQLVVSGAAAFAGTLSLFESTLTLAPGQSFELFDFASASGDFSSLEVDFNAATSLGGGVWEYGGLRFTEVWTGTSMSIAVSAAPSAVPEIDPSGCGGALAAVLAALGLVERKARRRGRPTAA